MKISEYGYTSIKIKKTDEIFKAQKHLIETGQLVQYASGVFGLNIIMKKTMDNIQKIIKDVFDKHGLIEVSLPLLHPKAIWEKSNRYNEYIESETMLVTETNQGEFCLAPTAEEAVVEFARENLNSYKQLPVTYYQISEKFRNEIRNRGFLFRGKCFLMMDAYSFSKDKESSKKIYEKLKAAYNEIFEIIGLPVIPIAADPGAIGGSKSEEFMLISPLGEDTILYDKEDNIGLNTEVLEKENYKEILKNLHNIDDISKFKEVKAIELGHIFNLGTKYSESMNFTFTDEDEKQEYFEMGCYGIGVSRLLATIYEYFAIKDTEGNLEYINLPISVAPFFIQIVSTDERLDEARKLYDKLNKEGISVILDDREGKISLGSKINEVKTLGTPFVAILGNKDKEKIEIEEIRTKEKQYLTEYELIEFLKSL